MLAYISLSGSDAATEVVNFASVLRRLLCRIMRIKATAGFLHEPRPENTAHISLSAPFITNLSSLDAARFLTKTAAPTALHMFIATQRNGIWTDWATVPISLLSTLHSHFNWPLQNGQTCNANGLPIAAVPGPETMDADVEATARLWDLSRVQLINECGLKLGELMEMVNDIHDNMGRLVVVNRIRSPNGATVAVRVKYQADPDGPYTAEPTAVSMDAVCMLRFHNNSIIKACFSPFIYSLIPFLCLPPISLSPLRSAQHPALS